MTRSNGFTGPIQVNLQGAPPGVSGSGALASGATSLQVQIIVGGAVAPQALGSLSFRATSGSLAHGAPFALTVAPPLPPGTLSPDGTQATGAVQLGGTLSNTFIAGEPVPATGARDTTGNKAVRHGFTPSGSH